MLLFYQNTTGVAIDLIILVMILLRSLLYLKNYEKLVPFNEGRRQKAEGRRVFL
jgi:hypothetical protein